MTLSLFYVKALNVMKLLFNIISTHGGVVGKNNREIKKNTTPTQEFNMENSKVIEKSCCCLVKIRYYTM